MSSQEKSKTMVGDIDPEVLEFTAGKDYKLDLELLEADCIGSAAHVDMLSELPLEKPLFTKPERDKVVRELAEIMRASARGEFIISASDQDVHLAIERVLTSELGELGKKVHTARSRNDQVALDLRIYARAQLLAGIEEAATLAGELLSFAQRYKDLPMVGRTHMQPAMPSSVGLWAGAYAEGLLGDIKLIWDAYEQNDNSPLGSAASYGVPIPIDREKVARLLGFRAPCQNVLNDANMRGKLESIILSAMSQAMLTISRLAQDLILFSMPEFGYFSIPKEYCTGSSIMPQKNNPDVLELIRARTVVVKSYANSTFDIVQSSPSGYNRDLQEAKGPFMEGIEITRRTFRIMTRMISGLRPIESNLIAGFTPEVFATDRALELVAEGMAFRDAYNHVKNNLDELESYDPVEAIRKKTHSGAPYGMNFEGLESTIEEHLLLAPKETDRFNRMVSDLMGIDYPIE